MSVTGDTKLEHVEFTCHDGKNLIRTITRQRYHSAPASQTGEMKNPSETPKARVTYTASYPYALGRTVATANYGTNGGTALVRSSTIPANACIGSIRGVGCDPAVPLAHWMTVFHRLGDHRSHHRYRSGPVGMHIGVFQSILAIVFQQSNEARIRRRTYGPNRITLRSRTIKPDVLSRMALAFANFAGSKLRWIPRIRNNNQMSGRMTHCRISVRTIIERKRGPLQSDGSRPEPVVGEGGRKD
jgi:hypothetical protein